MKHLPHTRFSTVFFMGQVFSTKPKDFCLAESTELCYSGNALDLLDSDNERDLILKSDEEIFFTLPGRVHFSTDEKPPKKYETVSEIAPWKDWLTILSAMASITSVVSFYLSVPFVSRVTSFPISALMGTYSFMSESAA